MEIFWNTIASYNAATWPVQILLTLVAATLTLLLYLLLAGLVWWTGTVLIGQTIRFLQQFPSWWQELWQGKLQSLWEGFQLQANRVLERMNRFLEVE